MPKAITLACAGVSFGSVSWAQRVASSVKLLPPVIEFSSTKIKTCCPVASDKHLTSSELPTETRFAAAMTGPPALLQARVPATGHEVETYNTRLLNVS